jgi:hypothetical protein
MKRTWFVVVAATLAVGVAQLLTLAAIVQAAEEPGASGTGSAISQIWQRREKGVESARFVWAEKKVLAPGSIMAANEPYNYTGAPIPVQETEITSKQRFVFSGNKWRYEYEGQEFSMSMKSFVPARRTIVWDEQTEKFHQPDFPEFPRGEIRHEKLSGQEHAFKPLVLAYRLLNPKWTKWSASIATRDQEQALVQERACALVTILGGRPGGARITDRFFVDEARQCVVPRYGRWVNENQSLAMDIKYEDEQGTGSYPVEWTYSVFLNKQISESATSKVTQHEINPSVDPSEFDFQFPEKTLVVDTQAGSRYIVRPHDAKRDVTSEEASRGPSYSDLLATESGEAKQPSRRWVLPALCFVALVLITLGISCYRRSFNFSWFQKK